MIIVPQTFSGHSEEAANQLDVTKNSILPISENKETICMVWSSLAG